jgi:hypothetical protein
MLSPMPMSRHRFRPSMFRTADGPNHLPFPIQDPTRPRGRPSARVELQDRGVKISKSRTIHRNVSCVRSARLINPPTTNAFTAFPRYRFFSKNKPERYRPCGNGRPTPAHPRRREPALARGQKQPATLISHSGHSATPACAAAATACLSSLNRGIVPQADRGPRLHANGCGNGSSALASVLKGGGRPTAHLMPWPSSSA